MDAEPHVPSTGDAPGHDPESVAKPDDNQPPKKSNSRLLDDWQSEHMISQRKLIVDTGTPSWITYTTLLCILVTCVALFVSCLFREICSPSTPQLTQATAVAVPSVLFTFGFLLPGAVWLVASITSQSTFRRTAAGAAFVAGIGILATTLAAFIVATPATLENVASDAWESVPPTLRTLAFSNDVAQLESKLRTDSIVLGVLSLAVGVSLLGLAAAAARRLS